MKGTRERQLVHEKREKSGKKKVKNVGKERNKLCMSAHPQSKKCMLFPCTGSVVSSSRFNASMYMHTNVKAYTVFEI
jgi:hypothetical protein